MKKAKKSLALIAVIALLSSCSYGIVPVAATSNPVGSKVGEASSTKLFALFTMSEGGVAAAAKAGGITKISTVDVQVTQIGLYSSVKTIVTGE